MEPLRDWLADYMEYSKNNECCREYHYWTALSILGAVAKRQVYLQLPNVLEPVFLPLYTLIIGDSGSGKSTAVSYGKNLLSKIESVNILPNKGTMEAIVENLATPDPNTNRVESQGIIIASELALFLDKKKHNEGLVPWLLEVTECPNKWFSETRGGGRLELRNVAVSMLAASAPELLHTAVPAAALGNGFMARFICVNQTPVNTFFPFRIGNQISENKALNGLHRRAYMNGEIRLSREVTEIYISWYIKLKTRIRQEGHGNLYKAYDNRKADHLLKIAALIEWARNTEGFKRDKNGKMYMNISLASYREAEKELDLISRGLVDIYAGIREATGLSAIESEIIDLIITQLARTPNGIMNHSKLVKALYRKANAKVIRAALSTLEDMKELKKYPSKTGKGIVYELVKYQQLKQTNPELVG